MGWGAAERGSLLQLGLGIGCLASTAALPLHLRLSVSSGEVARSRRRNFYPGRSAVVPRLAPLSSAIMLIDMMRSSIFVCS